MRISNGKVFKYWTQYQQLHSFILLAVEIKKLLPPVLPPSLFFTSTLKLLLKYFMGQKIIKVQLKLKVKNV